MKKISVICLFFIIILMFVSCANFSSADSYLGNIYTKPTALTKINSDKETITETEKIETVDIIAETSETANFENDIQVEEDHGVGTYIITANGKKFHKDNCRTVKSVKQTVSYSDAVTLGYEPCKICNPIND